jgi:hypothetical protein
MLADCFGAEMMMNMNHDISIIHTEAIKVPTDDILMKVTGQHIMIIGGYYTGNLLPFISHAKSVTVFYNESDNSDDNDHIRLSARQGIGFASYVAEKLSLLPHMKIAQLLDEYNCGFPSEDTLNFQNGIYTLGDETNSDTERLMLVVRGVHTIEDVIKRGMEKRKQNLLIANDRLNKSEECTICGKQVLVAYGGSPIVDSCIVLSKKTGIGMLMRHDKQTNITLFSCRVTQESGYNAGDIMNKFIGGGGSRLMGGGSVEGIFVAGGSTVEI